MCGFNPVASAGRHARRRPGDGRRRGPRARHGRQLRLPPDHAGLGQHADLPGLHRGDARARRGEHRRCTVPAALQGAWASSAQPTSTSAIRQSPTSTGAVSASARSPRSRGCSPPDSTPLRRRGRVRRALAVWLAPFEPSHVLDGGLVDVPLPVKPMPSLEEPRRSARSPRTGRSPSGCSARSRSCAT